MSPRRYQRTRYISDDIPAEAIYVGRPTKWGNPFKIGEHGTRDEVVALFREYAEGTTPLTDDDLMELTGCDLVCWCPLDQPCHADILLALANDVT